MDGGIVKPWVTPRSTCQVHRFVLVKKSIKRLDLTYRGLLWKELRYISVGVIPVVCCEMGARCTHQLQHDS